MVCALRSLIMSDTASTKIKFVQYLLSSHDTVVTHVPPQQRWHGRSIHYIFFATAYIDNAGICFAKVRSTSRSLGTVKVCSHRRREQDKTHRNGVETRQNCLVGGVNKA